MKSKLFALTLISTLSACNLSKKRTVDPVQSNNALYTYFNSRQYATDDPDVVKQSKMVGLPVVAPKEAAFVAFKDRKIDGWACYNPTDELEALPMTAPDGAKLRFQDIGKIFLSGLSLNEAVPMTPNSTDAWQTINATLPAGDYTLAATDSGSQVKVNQPFTVLVPGEIGFRASVGDTGGYIKVPSPAVPSEGDGNYILTIDRTKDLYIAFNAPKGTTYVRLALEFRDQAADGTYTVDPTAFISCLGNSDVTNTLHIPVATTSQFPVTDSVTLNLDFVSESASNSMPGVKGSMVTSSVRQTHGLVVIPNDQGQPKAIHLGVLQVQ